MSKASCVFVGLLLVLQFVSFSVASGESTDFVLRRVERLIDISTQLVKHSIKINAVGQNGGSSFAFVVPLKLKNYVASVLAVDATSGAKLRVGQPSVVEKPQSYVLYPIDLGRTVESSGSVDLRIELLVTHALKPFPNQINQGQSQLVRFKDNHYFFTPYVSTEQETKVKLSSPKFESYSYGPGAVNVKNDIITYGPYSKVQPFSHSDLEVHYENNSPFIVVRKLVKEYEVSHWGNLAVEETYDLEHTGAGLTGPFSRLDLQRQGAPGVVSKLTERLLTGASDVYYRDEIGNISTSNFNVEEDGTPKLQIQPRYILFGGWKINFYLGYNTPLHLYLGTDYQNSNVYVLNVTFGVDFEEPLVIDEEYVRIILPEGASDIQLHQPNSFSIERVGEEKRTTYLDTTGRPVLVLRKTNVVGGHNQYFQVTYHFRQINMLQEPLLLIGAFFLFFVTVMIYVRINLSISKANSQE